MPVSTPVARADEATDWKDLTALRKQIAEEPLKSNPDQARQQLQALYQSRVFDPVPAAEIVLQAAQITRTQLNKPEEATKMLEAGWQASQQKIDAAKPAGVMYLFALSSALVEEDKNAEAKSLLEANRAAIVAGGNSGNGNLELYASQTLQRLADVQDATREAGAKPEDTVALLKSSLMQMPVFLDPDRQRSLSWTKGWIYDRLMTALANTGHADEALQWGRLFFAESDFSQASIERATNALSGAWVAQGDLAKVRAFAAAQTGKEDNPLATVKFPTLDADALISGVRRIEKWQQQWVSRDRMPTLITLEIARGNWMGAMKVAQGMLQSQPTATDGPQQIARIFKAKDGSIARANQFLSYLEGKAKNPLPAFLAEANAVETPAP